MNYQGPTIGDLETRLKKVELVANRSLQSQEVGNVVFGGPLRTYIAGSVYSIGPFRMDVDATYPLEFDLYIPDYILKIVDAQVRLKPTKVRSSVAVTSAPSGAQTSEDGGGGTSGSSSNESSEEASPIMGSADELETVATQVHAHRWASFNSNTNPGYPDRIFDTYPVTGLGSATEGLFLQTETTVNKYTTFPHDSGTSVAGAGHKHTIDDHFHNIEHTHTIDDHSHIIPTHNHPLTLSIAEGGQATGLRLFIDGVDRSATLGGPWTAAARMSIKQFLINVRDEPVPGVHPIKITSTAIGAVEAFIDMYVVAKNPNP